MNPTGFILSTFITAMALGAESACPAPASGAFTACYYLNTALSGDPVLARTDTKIDFDWGAAPPAPSLANGFSVRWQGNFALDAGPYQFDALTSDGMRIYIDGLAILDRWRDQPPYMYTVRPTLAQGTHLVTVEHYQQSGPGVAGLSWRPTATPGQGSVIRSFTAGPSAILSGQTSALSWSVSGADAVTIDNGVGNVTNLASRPVSPLQTTTYTLTATGGGGTATASATVTVSATLGSAQLLVPPAVTVAPGQWTPFQVTLASAAPPGGVFISLSSSDPATATVSPANIFSSQGYTTAASAPKVSGIGAGSAIITATAAGLPPASGQVQVGSIPAPGPAPSITAFNAAPSSIAAGQAATLSWSVLGAEAVSIDQRLGTVSSAASKSVWPAQTTIYTLTAANGGGSTAARVTVTVKPALDTQPPTVPAIVSAIAKSPAEVDLVWTASTDNVGVAGYQINRNGMAIASVSSPALAYADTGVSASSSYAYSLKAFDASGNYSNASAAAQVTTPPASNVTVITSCQAITQSGRYSLGATLSAPRNASCIDIHDTHDVYLDCQRNGVTIDRTTDPGNGSAIVVTNVTNYSIANCAIAALNTNGGNTLPALSTVNSPRGKITGNTFSGGYVSLLNSGNLEISHNVSTAFFNVSGDNQTIEYNAITLNSSQIFGAVLTLSGSSGSVIQSNLLNGGWDGAVRQSLNLQLGADDGILLYNVNNTVVRDNAILDIWDTGIENVKPMTGVQILNNRISTAGISGIGGWYGDSLRNVVVSGNVVTDVPRLFDYWRADGLYAADGEQSVFFENNTFSGNTLAKPRLSFMAPGAARLDFQTLPAGIPAGALVAGNNRIANNDFGPLAAGVRLLPSVGIVDGGGNICSPNSTPGFPLNCAAPSPSGGYYAITAAPAAGAAASPGNPITVLFGANPGAAGDYIGLAAVGADDRNFVSVQFTGGSPSNALVFAAPASPGQYEFRYMRTGAAGHAALSNPVTVIVGR